MSYTAKSVIIDIADTFGATRMSLRSVEFKLAGALITVNAGNVICYATSEINASQAVEFAFYTGLSKTGTADNNQWTSEVGGVNQTDQRLICVFNSPVELDEIIVNNGHDSGLGTARGSQNVKINISTDAITDPTYNAVITNSTIIFVSTFAQHIASDVIDDQLLYIGIIIAESLGSVGELSSGVSGVVIADSLDGAGELSAVVYNGNFLTAEPLESTGELSANVADVVLAESLDSVGELSAVVADTVIAEALESTGEITVGAVVIFQQLNPSTLFFFILTGQPDGLDDVQIPIRSFQARHRTGKPTYLSITIPGTDYSQQISDRPNGEMIVRMAKVDQGAIYHTEEILRVALEEIRPDDGARNKSITLTGHATSAYGSKIVPLQGVVFQTGSAGKKRYRLATPDIFLRPGDTATYGVDSILVDNISYSVGGGQQLMEVAE